MRQVVRGKRLFKSAIGWLRMSCLVWSIAKKFHVGATLILIGTISATCIGVISPLALARLSQQTSRDGLLVAISLYLLTVTIPLSVNYWLGKKISVLAPEAMFAIRIKLIENLTALKSRMHEKISTGGKYSVIEADVTKVERVLRTVITNIPQYLIRIFGILTVVLTFKAEFFFVFLIGCLLISAFVFFPGRIVSLSARKAQRASEAATITLDKFLVHQRLFSSTDQTDSAGQTVIDALSEAQKQIRKSELISQLISSIPQFVVTFLIVSVLSVASNRSELISIGMIFALIMYAEQVLTPISMLAGQVADVRQNLPGIRSVSRHLIVESDRRVKYEEKKHAFALKITIRENVVFDGPLPNTLVLMAPNGAGKTTALMELCGLTRRESRNCLLDRHGEILTDPRSDSIYVDSHGREVFAKLYPGFEDPVYGFILEHAEWDGIQLICLDEVFDNFYNAKTVKSAIAMLHDIGACKVVTTHEPWIFQELKNAGAVGIQIDE